MKTTLGIVVLAFALGFAPPVNATPILQVDIGGNFVTGGSQVVEPGWSAFDLHELFPGPTDTATHSYGPITMSITATIYGEIVGLTFGQAPYPAGVTFPSVYDDAAVANVYGDGVGGGMKIAISGLAPGQQYSTEIWHWSSGGGDQTGVNADWYDDSSGHVLIGTFTTAPALPTSDTDYKDTFIATANGGGNLIFSASTGPNTGNFSVNGLRLTEVLPVPEPGTMTLLLAGTSLLGVIRSVRRRLVTKNRGKEHF